MVVVGDRVERSVSEWGGVGLCVLLQGSKLKPGRSPPVEYRAEKKRGGLVNKLSRDRRQDKRGSWGGWIG